MRAHVRARLDALQAQGVFEETKQKVKTQRDAHAEYCREYQRGNITPQRELHYSKAVPPESTERIGDVRKRRQSQKTLQAKKQRLLEKRRQEEEKRRKKIQQEKDYRAHLLKMANSCSSYSTDLNKTILANWEIEKILDSYRRAESSAPKRGLEFTLKVEDVIEIYKQQGGRCKLSGLRFNQTTNVPSIDRINNSWGYYRKNIQFTTIEINLMKGSLTDARLIQLCGYVTNNKKESSVKS